MKAKNATIDLAQGANVNQETNALTVVNKKMTVAEKLDSLMKLEALSSKHEYLTEVQQNLESFGTGDDGFHGAKIILVCNYKEVKVSNPLIMEEVTKLCRQKVKEARINAEKEIEAFTIQ